MPSPSEPPPVVARLRDISVAKLQDLVDRHRDDFCGIYVADDMYHLNITSTSMERGIRRVQDIATATQNERGVHVLVHEAKYSYAELSQIIAKIDTANPWAARSDGMRISVGINNKLCAVEVGVSHVTEELNEAAVATFGDAIRLIPDEMPYFPLRVEPIPDNLRIVRLEKDSDD